MAENDTQTSETTEQTTTEQTSEQATSQNEAAQKEAETSQSEPSWREDWREVLSEGDEKRLKTLSRYSTMENWAKAQWALRQKMDSGEYKLARPDPKDEAAYAEWRESNGIPEEAKGYLDHDAVKALDLDESTVEDAQKYLSMAHEAGATPDEVARSLSALKQWQQDTWDKVAEQDINFKREAEDELRVMYGPEYRANMNHMSNVLKPLMGDLYDEFNQARLPSGRKFADDPRVMDMFVNISRQLEPVGTLVTPDSEASRTAFNQRKAEIESMIKDTKSDYWTNPAIQAEYLKMLEMEDRMK